MPNMSDSMTPGHKAVSKKLIDCRGIDGNTFKHAHVYVVVLIQIALIYELITDICLHRE